MGACDFIAVSNGKTVRDAFASATSQAQWEHGHGGYTGTIAEKGSFIEFAIPIEKIPRGTQEVQRYVPATKSHETETIPAPWEESLTTAINWYRTYAWTRDWNGRPELRKHNLFTQDAPEAPAGWAKYLESKPAGYWEERWKRERDCAKFFHDLLGVRTWESLVRTYEDKWGPAVAIKTGDNEWTFLGMASS